MSDPQGSDVEDVEDDGAIRDEDLDDVSGGVANSEAAAE
jgi:hypothetical protein